MKKGRSIKMKTYIDIPVVAYQTWLIDTYYVDKDGNRISDEDDTLANWLQKYFPYRSDELHVF